MSEKISLRAYNKMIADDSTLQGYTSQDILAKYIIYKDVIKPNELNETLCAIWNQYDICLEYDENNKLEFCEEFDEYIKEIINEYQAYYTEMFKAYTKEYDYADAIVKKIENESIYVDLPNKIITPTDIYNYPSSGDKGSSTITSKDKFIALKLQYMAQIRDLYREFAYKFKDLFYHIYFEEENEDE